MNKKKITFDLDSVIFDIKPLYKTAFRRAGVPYQKPTSWILKEAYNNETVINNLLELLIKKFVLFCFRYYLGLFFS